MKDITRRSFIKDITRRDFIKGLAGTVGLGAAPSIAFTAETKEDKLRKEVSDLMEKADMYIEYQKDNPTYSVQLIDPKQIIGVNIPIKKLSESKKRLIEHLKEYNPPWEESGVLYVYENIDIT